jgi:SAM-dependent methyltransferase
VTDPTRTQQATGPGQPAGQTPLYFNTFPDLYERFTAAWDNVDHRFTNWILSSIPDDGGTTALDLGCGAGRHTILLANRYQQVLAVDIADRMLDIARGRRAHPAIDYQRRGILDVTPDSDGQYDLVLSVHALHHVGDPTIVLAHVRSLVAPGGTAVIADIIDPGGWDTGEFHVDRAFGEARQLYQLTGDPQDAAGLLRLLLHPRWLEMAAAEPPLTREAFHRHYSDTLPGVVFTDDLHRLMCGAVWRNPATPTQPAAS